MQAILPARADHALHSVAQTRAIEQAALGLQPRPPLMERAGEALARLAMALAPHAQRVWIAAGPGNNGGDGLEAALHLRRSGREVDVTLCAAANPPPDAQSALQRAQAAGVSIRGSSRGRAIRLSSCCASVGSTFATMSIPTKATASPSVPMS